MKRKQYTMFRIKNDPEIQAFIAFCKQNNLTISHVLSVLIKEFYKQNKNKKLTDCFDFNIKATRENKK